jgi:hypothetical protein
MIECLEVGKVGLPPLRLNATEQWRGQTRLPDLEVSQLEWEADDDRHSSGIHPSSFILFAYSYRSASIGSRPAALRAG